MRSPCQQLKEKVTGATVPWLPGSGVGRRPHRGRDIGSLPAIYLSLCVVLSHVCTLGLVHLRTGHMTSGTPTHGLSGYRPQYSSSALICSSLDSEHRARRTNLLLIRLPLHIVNLRRQQNSTNRRLSEARFAHGKGGLRRDSRGLDSMSSLKSVF